MKKLASKYRSLSFCYEAGPTGYELYRLIKRLGHDCIVAAPSLIPAGGLSECKKIVDMAEAFGARYNPHVWGTGIAIAASLRLLAVLPTLTPNSLAPIAPMLEFDRTEHPIRAALLTSSIEHRDGRVAVPTGAGLGIEIDRAALERFRVTN